MIQKILVEQNDVFQCTYSFSRCAFGWCTCHQWCRERKKIIQCCKYYDTWLKSIPYCIHEILLWCQSDTFSGQIFWVCIFTVKNQYKHFSWNISVLRKLMFTYLIVSVTWGIASVNVSSKFILLRGWDW